MFMQLEKFPHSGLTGINRDMKCFSFGFKRGRSSKPRADLAEAREVIEVADHSNFRIYSFNELKAATRDFRASKKIGEGGFGSVYKGKLRDGTLVAVKVLSAESKQGDREFLAELSAISDIRHENLVTLKGCCADGTSRILVYDYLENNSLSQTLFGEERGRINFNWVARRGVCFGVARGLSYLHENVRPRIVHRDIKAGNILLDKHLNPKISDFGLAKLFPDDVTHLSTTVAGTLGYLAPEYAIRGKLTRKADVYSFGVLVLEIISGRSVKDLSKELDEQHLVEKAWELYKADTLLQMVDPILISGHPSDEAFLFLKVALLCVQETPSLRPSMPEVVMMMSNEMDISDIEVSKPGFVTDFMALKTVTRRVSRSPISRDSPNFLGSPSYIN